MFSFISSNQPRTTLFAILFEISTPAFKIILQIYFISFAPETSLHAARNYASVKI